MHKVLTTVYTIIYTVNEVIKVETAKLFVNGQSQAVRLPKECRFSGSEVYVKKVGNTVMLFPKKHVWETFLNGLDSFTDDFFADGRNQSVQAPRKTL